MIEGSEISPPVQTDEDLVLIAQAGKEGSEEIMEFLIEKYKNFVRIKAKHYFLVGADSEDLIQEGMIGLYKAVRDFRMGKLSSFRSFADLCITRQIITAMKTATRHKHSALNSYVSLDKSISREDDDRTLADIIPDREISDPGDELAHDEQAVYVRAKIFENLSELETVVLNAYLVGKSYAETAKDLDRGLKSVDNALQRVKRKISTAFDNEYFDLRSLT